jgi:hypothetical protein
VFLSADRSIETRPFVAPSRRPGVAEQTCHTSSPVTVLGSRLASNMMSMFSAGDPRSFDSDAFGKCV